jgi:hypothetical protein
MSIISHAQLHDLQEELQALDTLIGKGSMKTYLGRESVLHKKVYIHQIGEHDAPKPIMGIWKTCNLPKQNCIALTL